MRNVHTTNYLGDVERGTRNPSLINLKKIADGLKKPLADLLTGVRMGTGSASVAKEKTAVYFSVSQDKDLLTLIRILRASSPKDRKRIVQIARALGHRLKEKQ